jgi:type I restriction enzyme, S subunit
MKWPYVEIGDIATDTQYGTGERANDKGHGLPVLRMGNITYEGQIDLSDIKWVEIAEPDLPKYTVRQGDLLFNRTNSHDLVGKTAVWNYQESVAFAGYLVRVRFQSEIADPNYISAYLNSPYGKALLRTKAKPSINMSNISASELLKFAVPLPPLPEQQRIAAILDAAEAVREKRRQALAKLDTLVQAVFLEMFGDPVINPKKFARQPLGKLIRVKSGDLIAVSQLSQTGKYPVFGGNGINGYHDEFMFAEPTIVIGRVGVYCGVVHVTEGNSWVTDNALFVAERSTDLGLRYLASALHMANLNQYSGRAAQPLVSGSRIYPVPILVPPLELQHEFEHRYSKIKSLQSDLEKSASYLNTLFTSLQQRAFRGEL